MKAPGKIHVTVWLLGLAGAALFTGLLIRQGIGQVWDAFATAEWTILGIVVYHLIPVFFDAVSWGALFPKSDRPRLFQLLWMRWIGESVSTLVPSAAVGGDIVRARLAAISGTPLPVAAGSVLVDITLGIFIQAGFTLLGLFLLVDRTGKTSFVGPTLIGVVVALFAFSGFYFVQRLGIFSFLARIISRLAGSSDWQSLVQRGDTLDRTVRSLYARRGGVVASCILTMTSLIVGSGEIWLALWALDLPASFVNAAHPAKYRRDDSVGCVCSPRWSGCAGGRLSCGWKFARNSRRRRFCSLLGRARARNRAWRPRSHHLAVY